MALRLISPSEPTAAEAVLLRVKKQPRPDGMLQCPRCGCRQVLNTAAGVIVKDGRKQRGTVIDKDECAECWKRGEHVSMLPAAPTAAT